MALYGKGPNWDAARLGAYTGKPFICASDAKDFFVFVDDTGNEGMWLHTDFSSKRCDNYEERGWWARVTMPGFKDPVGDGLW